MRDIKAIEKTVDEIRTLKAMKEELENELKGLENEVITYMNEEGKTELVGSNFKATYKEQSRVSLDKEELTKIFGDDLKPYEKVSTFNVLRIK